MELSTGRVTPARHAHSVQTALLVDEVVDFGCLVVGREASVEVRCIWRGPRNPSEEHIATEVNNRTVTLTGIVQTAAQRYAAEQIAWQVTGVRGVTNNLSTTSAQTNPESPDEKLAHRVEFELYSTKAISLKTVQIHADNGTITLTGNVLSRAEKTAQSVEGVRKVVNSLAAPDEMQS